MPTTPKCLHPCQTHVHLPNGNSIRTSKDFRNKARKEPDQIRVCVTLKMRNPGKGEEEGAKPKRGKGSADSQPRRIKLCPLCLRRHGFLQIINRAQEFAVRKLTRQPRYSCSKDMQRALLSGNLSKLQSAQPWLGYEDQIFAFLNVGCPHTR